MTSMTPLRCTGIQQVVLSDEATAVLLELRMANGKIFPLELDAGGVSLLTRALLVCGQALGEKQTPRPPLTSTPLSETVQLRVQSAHAVRQADGKAALMLRSGTLDLSLDVSDAAVSQSILDALQRPQP